LNQINKPMNTTIVFLPVIHRNLERILLRHPYKTDVNNTVRSLSDARWSQTHKAWHIPLEETACKTALEKLRQIALVDISILSDHLKKRKALVSENVPANHKQIYTTSSHVSNTQPTVTTSASIQNSPPTQPINPLNIVALKNMIEHLQLKAYSASTIKTYKGEMIPFLQLLGSHVANQLSTDDVRRYLHHCIVEKKLSENTIHSRINALKYYYEQVLGKEKFFVEVPRPKRPLQLPKLLNENELCRLFNSLENKKHKAMLFTAYSAGLRVSEVADLKLANIDSGRMQIFVGRAKGKKDRYVNLSPVLLDILRQYVLTYTPRPVIYLFESEQTKTNYPTRTIQQIFYNAKVKAGIRKEIGIHSLRHSFATHLLEKGVDIKYIKELLGHFNIKTTERYLHVSTKKLVNIISPFDDLMRTGAVDW
jgi:integrase/recombinase XerD